MLADSLLSELFKCYGIDYNFLDNDQKDLLKKNTNFEQMEKKLAFLFNVLGTSPKKIEQCLSVLYFDGGDFEKNYKLLLDRGINKEKIVGCLHILNTPSQILVETYDYIADNYGVEVFNKNMSILAVPVSRIVELENAFSDRVSKMVILSAAITTLRVPEISSILSVCQQNGIEVTSSFFQKGFGEISSIISVCKENGVKVVSSMFKKNADEVESIINICKNNGIEVTGSVFAKGPSELEKIIETCRRHNIEISGSVFRRDAEEIEEIVKVCKECGIKVSGTVFLRRADEIRKIYDVCRKYDVPMSANVFKKSADEIEAIVKVCEKYKVDVSTSLFSKSAGSLEKSIKYIKDNYGDLYITPLVLVTDVNHLKKVFPYLENKGTLSAVISTPAILSLKFDEILEREKFISSLGQEQVVSGKFNSIYGLSRKRYEIRKNEIANKKGSVGK